MGWTDRNAMPEDNPELDDVTRTALRDGLRAQPVPEPSSGFDARVLASVRGRSPVWDLLLSSLRPALATAAVSTLVTTFIMMAPVRSNPAVTPPPKSQHTQNQPDNNLRQTAEVNSYIGVHALRARPERDRNRLPGG